MSTAWYCSRAAGAAPSCHRAGSSFPFRGISCARYGARPVYRTTMIRGRGTGAIRSKSSAAEAIGLIVPGVATAVGGEEDEEDIVGQYFPAEDDLSTDLVCGAGLHHGDDGGDGYEPPGPTGGLCRSRLHGHRRLRYHEEAGVGSRRRGTG